MAEVSIPEWSPSGMLPPANVLEPTSPVRSPYRIRLTDFILRFATSPERCTILEGFLQYRAALHAVGLANGFQWIDGSFLENSELNCRRAPDDVDVVTFYRVPEGETQATIDSKAPDLFDPKAMKAKYRVDAFVQDLATPQDDLVRWSAYWYGVWSHQRESFAWKGFIELDLDASADSDAAMLLEAVSAEGTQS